MKWAFALVLTGLMAGNAACKKVIVGMDERNEIPAGTACGKEATINAALYQNATTYEFAIPNTSVSGDCLTVTIAASSCDGRTWEADLLDAGAIAKSLPPQRSLRITLKTTNSVQQCPAVYSTSIFIL